MHDTTVGVSEGRKVVSEAPDEGSTPSTPSSERRRRRSMFLETLNDHDARRELRAVSSVI